MPAARAGNRSSTKATAADITITEICGGLPARAKPAMCTRSRPRFHAARKGILPGGYGPAPDYVQAAHASAPIPAGRFFSGGEESSRKTIAQPSPSSNPQLSRITGAPHSTTSKSELMTTWTLTVITHEMTSAGKDCVKER